MGDRLGNIRWWDVTTGLSSSFNTHREGIRRIKFSPVVSGDRTRGRIAVLFYDNTFSIFDLVSRKEALQKKKINSFLVARIFLIFYLILRFVIEDDVIYSIRTKLRTICCVKLSLFHVFCPLDFS